MAKSFIINNNAPLATYQLYVINDAPEKNADSMSHNIMIWINNGGNYTENGVNKQLTDAEKTDLETTVVNPLKAWNGDNDKYIELLELLSTKPGFKEPVWITVTDT